VHFSKLDVIYRMSEVSKVEIKRVGVLGAGLRESGMHKFVHRMALTVCSQQKWELPIE